MADHCDRRRRDRRDRRLQLTVRLRVLGFLLLALCATGCVTRPTPSVQVFAERSGANSFELFHRTLDSSGLVLPVVQDRQSEQAACGAHAIASVINYWRGPGSVSGAALFKTMPPADRRGYSLGELAAIARAHGLLASPVRLTEADLVQELEHGRPVLIPIQAPAVYLDPRSLPGQGVPVVGFARNAFITRMAQISELTRLGLINHFVVAAGYEGKRFVVVDPVLGLRTISFKRLARYRKPFENAALVFSAYEPAPAAIARK